MNLRSRANLALRPSHACLARTARARTPPHTQDAMRAAAEQDAAAAAAARSRADELMAEAEVAAAERRMRAAELEYAMTLQEQQRLSNAVGQVRWCSACVRACGGLFVAELQTLEQQHGHEAAACAALPRPRACCVLVRALQDGERAESAKAAALAVAGGATGALPLLLGAQAGGATHALLSLAASLGCCALFGVTYRYAVRQDDTNLQLRGGVVAAFALVKALGAADVLQGAAEAGEELSMSTVGPGALYAAQCMLLFGFAAAALEAGFSGGLVKRMAGSSGDESSS